VFTSLVADVESMSFEQARRQLYALDDAVLLLNPWDEDPQILAASSGFSNIAGFSSADLVGSSTDILTRHVPKVALSRSTRKNVASFCASCRTPGVQIADTVAIQALSRKDGSTFVSFSVYSLCKLDQRPVVVCIHRHLCDGIAARSLTTQKMEELTEAIREDAKRIRNMIDPPMRGEDVLCGWRKSLGQAMPNFAFYNERLQHHCTLFDDCLVATRREADQLANGCMVFGDRPASPSLTGLTFSVRIEEALASFAGLPLLGFTRRKPQDHAKLYSTTAKGLGASVLVGAMGEAFAREQYEHFVIGFKQPPQSEVKTFSMQPDVPAHKRVPPVCLSQGDILECNYTWEGRIQMYQQGVLIIDFDTGIPIDETAEYYAVVDVSLSACSVALVPSVSPRATSVCTELEARGLKQCKSFGDLTTAIGSQATSCIDDTFEDNFELLSQYATENEPASCRNTPASRASFLSGAARKPTPKEASMAACAMTLVALGLRRSFAQ